MNNTFSLYDIVEFICDIPNQGVVRGDKGTILEFLNPQTVLIELADSNRQGLNKLVEAELSLLSPITPFEVAH